MNQPSNSKFCNPRHWPCLICLAVLLWSLSLFWISLGDHPLQIPDEGRYARASQVMLESGQWLVPQLYGKPRLEKPPLVYWLEAPAIAVFGANEFAVRLPSAIAATLTALVIIGFGWRIRDAGFGLIAGFVSALIPLHIMLARMSTTDAVLNLFFTIAFFSGYCAISEKPEYRNRFWMLFFVAIAGGLMTKGPVALLPVALVFVWIALAGTWRAVPWGRWLLGLALAALPLLAWSLTVAIKHPDALALWQSELISRAAGTGDHPRPIYFYLPVVLVGMFPASALLPLPGIHFSFAYAREAIRRAAFPAWCGVAAATWFVIFSLNGGKQTAYMLPLVAPIASIAAWQLRNLTEAPLDDVSTKPNPVHEKIGLGSLILILSAVWLILTLAGTAGTSHLANLIDSLALGQSQKMAIAVFPAVALAWVAWYLWRKPARRLLALLLLATGLNLAWSEGAEILEDGLLIPKGNPQLIHALQSNQLLTEHTQLVEFGYSDPTLDFYLNLDIEQISTRDAADLNDSRDKTDWLLLAEQKDWDVITEEHPDIAGLFVMKMDWHNLVRPLYVMVPTQREPHAPEETTPVPVGRHHPVNAAPQAAEKTGSTDPNA